MKARWFLAACALVLPAVAAAAEPAPTPIVIGQSYRLASAIMGEERVVNIWLPANYSPNGTRRFPVLYLLDGGADQDFVTVTALQRWLADAHLTRRLIVVGIAQRDRMNELTFAQSSARARSEDRGGGGAARFRRFIADEVKPWMTTHYRTDGDDGLMGQSLGGLFVIDTLLHEPNMFRRYIAVSPSLWWDEGALDGAAPALLARLDASPRWLWLSSADEEGMGIDRFVAALREAPSSLHAMYVQRPDEHHETTYQPAAIAALRTLYSPARQGVAN